MDYGFMAFPVWNEKPLPSKGIVFNFTYVLIVNLILTAIISGIIIDAFAEKRTQKQTIDDDTQNCCFIWYGQLMFIFCSNIEREQFEHFNIDFEGHTKNYHNMWAYIWFLKYLDETPREEYTGQEEYIWQLYSDNNTTFFPIKKVLFCKFLLSQALQIHGTIKQTKDIPWLYRQIDDELKNVEQSITETINVK